MLYQALLQRFLLVRKLDLNAAIALQHVDGP